MKRSSFLFGVSLSAILTGTGANAAGYTCEELIEYTSCMPGYYLSTSHPGYTYGKGWCAVDNDLDVRSGYTKESCFEAYCNRNEECLEEEKDYVYLGDGYYKPSEDMPEYDFIPGSYQATNCTTCPTGSICVGGTADKTACPAGSYCEGTGLSAATAKCAVGTYSESGAVACSSCPETSLTDKDGKTVVATTSGTGATSSAECFVGGNVEFKDNKGVYHYKSNCAYGSYISMFPAEEYDGTECPDNFVLAYLDDMYDEAYCVYLPQERCNEMHVYDEDYELYEWTWNGSKCECIYDADITYDKENDKFYCNW